MKSSELSVAILQTDEVLPEFVGRHGDYPEMFERLLKAGAQNREEPVAVRFHTYDARRGEFPPLGTYHGFLITGSKKSVYDDEAWISALAEFLKTAVGAGEKVVGICFGHQLMAHFFGGRVEPAEQGWAVGVQENRTVGREPWMDGEGDRLNLIASHKDQVTRLPHDARLIATSEFCPIGGFAVGDQIITYQGHPEFGKSYSRDLMGMRREILGEEVYQAGVESLDKGTDEDRVSRWIVRFLLGEGACS